MCVREIGQSHPSIAAGSVIWCLKEAEPRDLCNDWCHLIWCTVLKHSVASAGGTKGTISDWLLLLPATSWNSED